MRITWRTVGKIIEQMSDEQKDSALTVELPYGDGDTDETKTFPAEIRVAGSEHCCGEPEGKPLVYVHQLGESHDFHDDRDIEDIVADIGLHG